MAPPFSLFLLLLLLPAPGGAFSTASPSAPPWSYLGPHVSDLNVLLPPRMTNPVQYRLIGSGGCFKWSWDHHDILSVQPEYNGTSGCSSSARLTSIAPFNGRKETAIYATDIHSGSVIRCEVFIDKIYRIQIFHHSVKLDLGGLTMLRVRAFDDKENVFSSLVGLQFRWDLMPKFIEDEKVLSHLVHVPLKETTLSDCGGACGDLDTQIKLEDSNVGSDLYVVKGIEIGHEIVTVQFLEHHAEHLMDKIVLTVAELMSLDPPSPLFVIIGSSVQYNLRVIRQNNPRAINLPSPYHQWFVSNSTVAKVDLMMGTVYALNLGVTDVVVEDTRVSGHKQISAMHVVVPGRLSLYLLPVTLNLDPLGDVKDSSFETWYIIAAQQYVVHVKVYSSKPDEKDILLCEGNEFKIEMDNHTYLNTSVSNEVASRYGWQNPISLIAYLKKQETLTAYLTYQRGNSEIIEVLKLDQKVVVCDKVSVHIGNEHVNSEVVRLPWVAGIHQEVALIASGGCARTSEDYKWFSSNESVVSVSEYGVLRSNHPGRTSVKVVSAFDSFNSAEVTVEVSIPSSMVMLPYFPVEGAVGAQLQAAVTLNTADGNYYHFCDSFSSHIRWKVLSGRDCFEIASTVGLSSIDVLSHRGEYESATISPCGWTHLRTYCPGRATIHAAFSSSIQFSDQYGNTILQASKRIACYPPLTAKLEGNGNHFGGYWVDSEKVQTEAQDAPSGSLEYLYLVPGAMMNILLLGGPEKWGEGVEFIDNIGVFTKENDAVVDGSDMKPIAMSTNGVKLYTVFCPTLGKYKWIFSRGNLIGLDHPLKAVENLELNIICDFPSSITLIVNEEVNSLDAIQSSVQDIRGPGHVRLSPISVANGRTIRLAAVGIHENGRAFANSSSLGLRWELTNCQGLAQWAESENERLLTSWEQFLSLQNESGQCIVRATAIGFMQTVRRHLSAKASLLFNSTANHITDAVKLQLVASLAIIPESILLFSTPQAQANVSIIGGTCFLEAAINDTQVSEIVHYPGSTKCSWLVLGARGLGAALLTIYDKGLSPPAVATAVVKVGDVEWIKLISQDEIFMMEGSTESFDILVGTQDGRTFDSSQYMYINVNVHLEEDVLRLIDEGGLPSSDQRLFQPSFVIKAEKLGFSSIYISTNSHSGNTILSERVMVEVFSALKIQPHYIFLAPGASYTISVEGGPTGQVGLEYNILGEDVASIVRSSGRLSAVSVGNAIVRVSSYGNGGSLICEAFGTVEVGIPPLMTLNVQSERLCVGCQMPAYPSYPQGNLFSFYEVCSDYKWAVEDEKVLTAYSGSREKTSSYKSNIGFDGFIKTLYGRSAGKTKVSVTFACDFVSSGRQISMSYEASQLLRVVPGLPLALGVPITWVLPPFYTTTDVLPEFTESSEQTDLHHRRKRVSYALLQSCEQKRLAQVDAITIAGTKIKTGEKDNLACLQAKDQSGRVEIACCVRVAEVTQVRVTMKEIFSYTVHLTVNQKLDLEIGYCDDLGYPFSEARDVIPLDVASNFNDVVSIHVPLGSNNRNYRKGLFHLQAHIPGKALVKVSIKNDPQKSTYILILVGAQLFPRNPVLHVGDFLNFSIVGDGKTSLATGRLLSSNETVLFVERNTGNAHARAHGKAQVHFESSNAKLHTTVTVLESKKISVLAPLETLTNVPFPSEGYKFVVRLSANSDPLEYKLSAAGTTSEASFDCRIDPPFIGYTKPWRDNIAGVSYCLFFPYSPEHLFSFVSELKNVKADLLSNSYKGFTDVSITASLKDAPQIVGSCQARFVGGFAVSKNVMLNFTPNFNETRITIIGNTDIQISWNYTKLLLVKPFRKDYYGILERIEYEVKVLNGKLFTDKITVVLPATGQMVELGVSYDSGKQSVLTKSSGTIWVVLLVCLTVLLPTVIVFVRYLDKPDTSRISGRQDPLPSSVGSPMTPQRTSASPGGASPNRTPQPFMEYVRTTLDETPYYKRGGRRRFDPQYTY